MLNGQVHVLVAGEGPPVIMVIGGGMVTALWAPIMAHLSGRTLYAVELPGHGLTGSVRYDSGTLRSTAVTFLTQVMDGLQVDRARFIGQSIGGLWSTWLALDVPERVSAISYVSCPAAALGSSAPLPLRISTIRRVRALINTIDPPSPKQVQRMGRMNGEDLSNMPEVSDLFLAYQRLPGCLDALLDLHRAVVRVRGARPEVELTAEQLSRLCKPVQMIWGDRDPYGAPEIGEQMVSAIGHGSVHVFPGGHGVWLEQPEAIGPVINDFFDRTD
ncbi:MAG TPA: alpha/beta hydrolase [Acidimicrobiia bacterium]|nr:alpha/beta hydrolase [Acidimicrobiia bacterium]